MNYLTIGMYKYEYSPLSPWARIPKLNLANLGWGCITRSGIHPQGNLARSFNFYLAGSGYDVLDWVFPPNDGRASPTKPPWHPFPPHTPRQLCIRALKYNEGRLWTYPQPGDASPT